MQPVLTKVAKLKANPNNPRYIKGEKFEKLVQSIIDFPEMMRLRPIVTDAEGKVLGGNMRLKAAKKAGLKEVWTIPASELTPEQQREFIIKDNVGFGDWDYDILAADYDPLELESWGLEIPDYEPEEEPDTTEDDIPEEPKEAFTKLGDVWKCGEHTVVCGDSTSVGPGHSDMVITDPPYGVSYDGGPNSTREDRILNDDLDEGSLAEFWRKICQAISNSLKAGGCLYVTVPSHPVGLVFENELRRLGWLRQRLVWLKDQMVLGRSDYHYKHEPILYGWKPGAAHQAPLVRTLTSVIEAPRPKVSKEHPTMKPIELWAQLIKNSSSRSDVVLDPFLGSGTTLIACERLNRICYGIELEPKYVDVICQRYYNETGIVPIRESDGKEFPINDH